MFIGRQRELQRLNALYNMGNFQMPVIYGRRRVGKTALINEFVTGKNCIYFTAVESGISENLTRLHDAVEYYETGKLSVNSGKYTDFTQALTYIFELALQKQVIFVIDEYPYAAKADKALSSILQSLIDKYKDRTKLFLILCGSSMSFMEYQVLGYESPIYGRRTAQIKLEPFTFLETRMYLKEYSALQAAYIYGMVGGTPQYLLQINTKQDLETNVKNNILDTTAYLFEEPLNLMKQEVRNVALYNAVIGVIANGSTRLGEIASKVGIETSACTTCLQKLMSLGIVTKETPFGEKVGKRSLYFVSDNMFKFWYRYVSVYNTVLQVGAVDAVYAVINRQIDSYMGFVFEDICKQYLLQQNLQGKLPLMFLHLGRWWGTNTKTKQQEEVDIICSDGNDAILCECKWRNELVGVDVLDKLYERSTLFNYKRKFLYIFTKTGFTQACIQRAQVYGNVRLITFGEMYK